MNINKTTYTLAELGVGCAIIKTPPNGPARPMFAGYGHSRARNQARLANIARYRQEHGQVVQLVEGALTVYQQGAGKGAGK